MLDRQTCLTAVQEKLPDKDGDDVFVSAMSGMLLGAQKPRGLWTVELMLLR